MKIESRNIILRWKDPNFQSNCLADNRESEEKE